MVWIFRRHLVSMNVSNVQFDSFVQPPGDSVNDDDDDDDDNNNNNIT